MNIAEHIAQLDSFYKDLAHKINPMADSITIKFDPMVQQYGSYRAKLVGGKVKLSIGFTPLADDFDPMFNRALQSAMQIRTGYTHAVAITGKE